MLGLVHAVGKWLAGGSSQLPFQQPWDLLHLLGSANAEAGLGEEEVTLGLITELKQCMENLEGPWPLPCTSWGRLTASTGSVFIPLHLHISTSLLNPHPNIFFHRTQPPPAFPCAGAVPEMGRACMTLSCSHRGKHEVFWKKPSCCACLQPCATGRTVRRGPGKTQPRPQGLRG